MVENLVLLQVAAVSGVEALLHCAIFSATCLAMCPRNEKQEMCACALVKTVIKLRDKLLKG